jgi:hypothetical protein
MVKEDDYRTAQYVLRRSSAIFPTESLRDVFALMKGIALERYPPHGSGFLPGFIKFLWRRFKRPTVSQYSVLLDEYGHLPMREACDAVLALLEEWKANESSYSEGAVMQSRSEPLTPDEIADRGTELYETRIRRLVEADNIDRYLSIDVTTGDYEIADKGYDAAMALRARNPNAQIWGLRIGHIAAASFGGGDTREKK